ncbi:hypothetical protein DL98DRAFT_15699 [Cadophora sp. DSE1049]|nr:hypothetical protein DL98DRAFT_15699 [Cadophora sp. DSE1049]
MEDCITAQPYMLQHGAAYHHHFHHQSGIVYLSPIYLPIYPLPIYRHAYNTHKRHHLPPYRSDLDNKRTNKRGTILHSLTSLPLHNMTEYDMARILKPLPFLLPSVREKIHIHNLQTQGKCKRSSGSSSGLLSGQVRVRLGWHTLHMHARLRRCRYAAEATSYASRANVVRERDPLSLFRFAVCLDGWDGKRGAQLRLRALRLHV